MRDYGGFEHNMQSLRIVDELEEKYAEFSGLNLTFETREGILKHCSAKNAARLGELGRRFLSGGQPGLEAQLANIADEIAYNNHDVDDGLRAGLLSFEDLCEVKLFREQYENVHERYPQLPRKRTIHEIIRNMINRQITDLLSASVARLREASPPDRAAVLSHVAPLIGFGAEMQELNLELKRFLRERLYRHYRVHRMTSKAQTVIKALFDAFMQDIRLLPGEARQDAQQREKEHGVDGRARAAADYIAGMTDRYAILEYNRMFDPAQLT
jgi:dGTPase